MAWDFYESSVFAETPTSLEIQRAYRRLARQHHPDVNKDPLPKRNSRRSPRRTTLSDPEQRKRYDAFGEDFSRRVPPDVSPEEWRRARAYAGAPRAAGRSGRPFRSGGVRFTDGDEDIDLEDLSRRNLRWPRRRPWPFQWALDAWLRPGNRGDHRRRGLPRNPAQLTITGPDGSADA